MWDVRDMGCGMFAGMWDVDLQNAKIFLYDFPSNKILSESKPSIYIVVEIIISTIFNINFF